MLPSYTANNAQNGLELSDDPIEATDISDWDQQCRLPMPSDKRRGYKFGRDYCKADSTMIGLKDANTQQGVPRVSGPAPNWANPVVNAKDS